MNRVNIFEKKNEPISVPPPPPPFNSTLPRNNTYEPPNLIRYESTYQYQPKISARNMQTLTNNTTAIRGPSPPSSPKGINFSY